MAAGIVAGRRADANPAGAVVAEARDAVIAHIVLFRPRADVAEAERLAFVAALEQACRDVP